MNLAHKGGTGAESRKRGWEGGRERERREVQRTKATITRMHKKHLPPHVIKSCVVPAHNTSHMYLQNAVVTNTLFLFPVHKFTLNFLR